MFQTELAHKFFYKTSISSMRLRFLELEKLNDETQKIRANNLKDVYEKVDRVLYHQKLPFVPETTRIEIIN